MRDFIKNFATEGVFVTIPALLLLSLIVAILVTYVF